MKSVSVTGGSGKAGRALGQFDTLLSIEKARRVLGYAPQHTWRT
jgi:hypothetical protein